MLGVALRRSRLGLQRIARAPRGESLPAAAPPLSFAASFASFWTESEGSWSVVLFLTAFVPTL